jgi:hypothetical protein
MSFFEVSPLRIAVPQPAAEPVGQAAAICALDSRKVLAADPCCWVPSVWTDWLKAKTPTCRSYLRFCRL